MRREADEEGTGLPVDRIERFIEANIAVGLEIRELFRDPSVGFEPRDGYVLLIDRNHPIPHVNGMFVTGPREPDIDEMRRVRDELAAEALPLGVQLIDGRTPLAEAAVRDLGLVEIDVGLGMDLEPHQLIERPAEGIELRWCSTTDDLHAMVSIVAEAFEAEESSFPSLLRMLEPDKREVTLAVLAEDQSAGAVGTAGVFLSRDDGAVVANVGTRVAWRRRGIGSAVTAAVAKEAFERGAGFAWLIAAPDGVGPYRSVGFREVCPIRIFAAPEG
jgi:ribosomal protein S18 acetylase RimI-like enzyme